MVQCRGVTEHPPMKISAAAAFEARQPLEVVELDLNGPRMGEVGHRRAGLSGIGLNVFQRAKLAGAAIVEVGTRR